MNIEPSNVNRNSLRGIKINNCPTKFKLSQEIIIKYGSKTLAINLYIKINEFLHSNQSTTSKITLF